MEDLGIKSMGNMMNSHVVTLCITYTPRSLTLVVAIELARSLLQCPNLDKMQSSLRGGKSRFAIFASFLCISPRITFRLRRRRPGISCGLASCRNQRQEVREEKNCS